MQRIIALAGKKGSGKDTLADLLKPEFQRASFADPLYSEVQSSYGLETQDLLRNRDSKELPTPRLSLTKCNNAEFIEVCQENGIDPNQPLSPRRVLQLWGTEYRQFKNGKQYWVEKLISMLSSNPDTDYCIPDMRFPHEYEALLDYSFEGDVQFDCVRILRDLEEDSTSGHISETALGDLDIFAADIQNINGEPEAMLRSLKNHFLV